MILDEIGDPSDVRVWHYEGPLFIDLKLPTDRPTPIKAGSQEKTTPLTPDDIEIGDVEQIAQMEAPQISIAQADTGSEMIRAIIAKAFPNLYQAIFVEPDLDDEGELVVESIREAVRQEAMLLVEASWRQAGLLRSDDPDSVIAAQMGTSVELVRAYRGWAEEAEHSEDE
jgi:hypothetical protein